MWYHSLSYPQHGKRNGLKVVEVLSAAREAAMELRKIDERTELMRQAIGPQGYHVGVHAKSGILDPTRHIDEIIDWETIQRSRPDVAGAMDEAWDVVSGIAVGYDQLVVDIVTAYYLRAESWVQVARTVSENRESLSGLDRAKQVKAIQKTLEPCMAEWERIGIARLKEMGRSHGEERK